MLPGLFESRSQERIAGKDVGQGDISHKKSRAGLVNGRAEVSSRLLVNSIKETAGGAAIPLLAAGPG